MKDNIKAQIQESIKIKRLFSDKLIADIAYCAKKIIKTFLRNGKILICGNGGSAADSQHFAAELISKYKLKRKSLPAIALTVNTSILTSIGNDYCFDKIFSRQIEALGRKKDILFTISTSGNSKNIIEAINQAKKQNIFTIGLTGKNGRKMAKICDIILQIPSKDTPRIQECHVMIIHIICDIVEKAFYKNFLHEKSGNIHRS